MQNLNFSNQVNNLKRLRYTTPQDVSVTENPGSESHEQIILRQDKFLTMSKNVRYKLSSSETSQKIQAIGQKYGFELLRLANITRLIREYYFGEVRFEDFPTEIEKRVRVSLLTAQEITRYIKQEIIDWDPWAEYIAKLPKMTVREIIEKHPKIADTEITSGYVELGGSEDLSDPTIKNWIQDYVSHLGYAKHSQMQRTEYLFRSENGRGLSSQDREKLGIILKSFDENVPLPVDEENGEIVFDEIATTSPQPSPYQREEVARTLPEKIQPSPQPSLTDQRYVKDSGEARATAIKQQPTIKPIPTPTPIAEPIPAKPESFIKPYRPTIVPQKQTPAIPAPPETGFINPAPQFQRPTLPPRQTSSPQPSPYQEEGVRPAPIKTTPTQVFAKPTSASQPSREINYIEPSPQPRPVVRTPEPEEFVHPNLVTQPSKQMIHKLNKHFNAPETPDIPAIKIHSITERTEPQTTPPIMPPRPMSPPQPNIQRPIQTSPQSSPHKEEGSIHPRHRMIDPFPERFSGPKIDGNVVDLSGE
jgi:hypothetical protein